MTRKLKITPGKWEQDNGFLYCDTIKGSAAIFANTKPSQDVANAELAAEAFNVANETGLMPRELLAQRDELLAMLSETVALYGQAGGPWNIPSDPGGWLERARSAIARVRGGK